MVRAVDLSSKKNADDEPATTDSLISALESNDGLVRQRARQSLVRMDGAAVAPLIEALKHPKDQVRWEAAKALREIRDPAAAPSLVRALEDKRAGIRWLAAEGLIGLGRAGLKPLLQALAECKPKDSVWLLEGAHHVIRTLIKQQMGLREVLSPVLSALEDIEPALEVCPAAFKTLDALATGSEGMAARSLM